MLLSFKVENFKSIGAEIELNLEPARGVKEYPEYVRSFADGKYQALNAAVIYGANASGKSNIMLAFRFVENLILIFRRGISAEALSDVYQKFKLRAGYEVRATSFEIIFIYQETKYRYAFSLTLENNQIYILSEGLYRTGKQRESMLFERNNNEIKSGKSYTGVSHLKEITRSDTLFLSVCDQFNIEEAIKVIKWFRNIAFIDNKNVKRLGRITSSLIDESKYKYEVLEFILKMNTDIRDITVKREVVPMEDIPEELRNQMPDELKSELFNLKPFTVDKKPFSVHSFYDSEGYSTDVKVDFELQKYESDGTQKAYNLAGIFVKTLLEGGILIIDELEASLHPSLVRYIVLCFLLNEKNKIAQLILVTHDTHLIDKELFRPDQIYFAEKNNWESTILFPLVDYRKELKKLDYEEAYLAGDFGGVPYIDDLPDFLFNLDIESKEN